MQQSGGVIGFVVTLNAEYITLTLTIRAEDRIKWGRRLSRSVSLL